jgi:uncharacterized SAM-dependent methyltransferase
MDLVRAARAQGVTAEFNRNAIAVLAARPMWARVVLS